jgi:hypothetical protein
VRRLAVILAFLATAAWAGQWDHWQRLGALWSKQPSAAAAAAWQPPEFSNLVYGTTFEPPYQTFNWHGDTNLIFGPRSVVQYPVTNGYSYHWWWSGDGVTPDPNRAATNVLASGNVVGVVTGIVTAVKGDLLVHPLVYNGGVKTNWPSLTNWTFAVWIKPYVWNPAGNTYFRGVFSPIPLVDDNNVNTRWYFNQSVPTTARLTTNVWHHIALTYNYSAQILRGWVDGTNVATETANNNILGQYQWWLMNYNGGLYTLPGQYDDLYIWKTSLVTNDIQTIIQHGDPSTRAQ